MDDLLLSMLVPVESRPLPSPNPVPDMIYPLPSISGVMLVGLYLNSLLCSARSLCHWPIYLRWSVNPSSILHFMLRYVTHYNWASTFFLYTLISVRAHKTRRSRSMHVVMLTLNVKFIDEGGSFKWKIKWWITARDRISILLFFLITNHPHWCSVLRLHFGSPRKWGSCGVRSARAHFSFTDHHQRRNTKLCFNFID